VAVDATVVDQLAQANVLVVGDILLDRYIDGRVSRISPEAPVPVLRYGASRTLLGGAGNVAANILAYGGKATLVGLVGEDGAADELRAICARHHRLNCSFVADRSRPTTVKTRYLSGWQQLLRVDSEEATKASAETASRILEAASAGMKDATVVVLSDYAKGVLDAAMIGRIIEAARGRGLPVIVDPKKATAEAFAGATLMTPNADEMAQMAGMAIDSDEAAVAACRRVLDKVAIDAILLTRGEHGMTLVERGERQPLHVRAEVHRVFDVTGAGDTVIATLGAALSVGVPLMDAVRLANTAAGVVVAKPGTATVLPQELRQALGSARGASVVDLEEAAERAALWREQGLRVGFTNGCFDLLHRGHLFSLEQAARRCDRLVIGVNSDASTRRLKGAGRPVQDEASRAAVLAALRYPELVVIFEEDTPEGLIQAIRPDILFKGADYDGQDIAGADFVRANGGRVELLPLLKGHSTTGTLARMRAGAPTESAK
jgi:D-beta-D-heptose 7-phosphate kinase/D-beta-D-heptose 1-phosphate adenosyltransferase